MVFGLVAYSGEPTFTKQPFLQLSKPDTIMHEFPVDDPAAWEVERVVTLLQYLIGYTKVIAPFRRGINDNETLTRDSPSD